ncbi:hypothetical protein EJB05_12968, partial [Eragrostis curvula]
MAEAIAISLSAKLAVALSRSAAVNLSPLFGVRSDVAATAQDLDILRAFLRFADSRQSTDALAAAWVKQVRDAAFELEDVADECCYLSGSGRGWVNVKSWFALSRRLRKARERLSQLSAAKEQFGIHAAEGPASPITTTSRIFTDNAYFLKKEEIVGFADQEKQLLEWLVKDVEQRRTLVAVCGMGGVGKTTLVTRVYKEVATSHFECAAWVAVSQTFTVEDLLRKILKELHSGVSGSSSRAGNDAGDYRSLVLAVQGRLERRRYLVVLDDVWDAHLWDKLRHAFPDDAFGSRVVMTTRSGEVAKAAALERTMMLEPLPWNEAWKLFCNVAFGEDSNQMCPQHLVELANSMLQRCRGLPLAIVSIGKLLALKERTEFAWRNARDSLVWDRCSNDYGIGEAASILNLSIDDLPHHLKKCFLSCSILPEDFLIKRKILIRSWVAQGFIDEKPGQCTAEDLADDYLDQLVHRNLMQAVARNDFGRAKRCLIHDLIRELIVHRSREEDGFFQFSKCKITMDSNVRARHLAVDRCEVDCQSVPKAASLRSFHAFGSECNASFLSSFRLLTLLNLWFIDMYNLPDSVTNLHNLRYLGIRSTFIEELPRDLGKLQKLQTLDAKWSMVRRLPSSTGKLKNLRHLILFTRETDSFWMPFPGKVARAPDGLDKLTSLQTLKYVQADEKMVKSLGKLEQMKSLELSGVDARYTADLLLSISRMSCLVCLLLEMEPGESTVLDLELITKPPRKLQKLALTGRLARGKLPSWTNSLTSLVRLRLFHCDIGQDSLMLLAELPSLLNLSLIATYQDRKMTFPGGSFSTLQKLTLQDLPNLCHIEFQQGCLSNLSSLVLSLCMELTEIPQGMARLMRLQNFEVFDMPAEFVHKLKLQNGHAGYYKPVISEFDQGHQAPAGSRYLRWFQRKN